MDAGFGPVRMEHSRPVGSSHVIPQREPVEKILRDSFPEPLDLGIPETTPELNIRLHKPVSFLGGPQFPAWGHTVQGSKQAQRGEGGGEERAVWGMLNVRCPQDLQQNIRHQQTCLDLLDESKTTGVDTESDKTVQGK